MKKEIHFALHNWVYTFQKHLFIYLKGNQTERDTYKKRQVAYAVIHSSNTCNSQYWVR